MKPHEAFNSRRQRKLHKQRHKNRTPDDDHDDVETPSPTPVMPPQLSNTYRQHRQQQQQQSLHGLDGFAGDGGDDDDDGQTATVMEYSDTSDDYYFRNNIESQVVNRRHETYGESSFRKLRNGDDEGPDKGRSSRIVRYGATSPAHSPQRHPPNQPDTPVSHPSTPVYDNHRAPGYEGSFRNWISSLAYSFRSPARQEERSGTGLSGMLADQGFAGSAGSLTQKIMHRRQRSSTTMEYPFRVSPDPSRTVNSVSGKPDRKPQPAGYETSPLLAMPALPTESAVYGGMDNAHSNPYNSAHPFHARFNAARNDNNNNNNLRPHKTTTVKVKNRSAKQAVSFSDHDTFSDEFTDGTRTNISLGKAAMVAAYFLKDYEAGRPPTLSSNFSSITPSQLQLYRICMSFTWRWMGLTTATFMLFYAHTQNRLLSAWLHTFAITIFIADIRMREEISGDEQLNTSGSKRCLNRPMILFLVLLGLESWFWYFTTPNEEYPKLITSLFKPLVFFYVSSKARDAFEAVWRIGGIVSRVLLIEVFLILAFAAVACRMFHGYSSFENLSTAWLSLFQLSTTVVNPSLWMPMYHESRSSAFFFIFFIVIATFYLHSLVLSVVFQTYIQAASEIHERPATNREDAIRLAFAALASAEYAAEGHGATVSVIGVRKALKIVRPHYSSPKVKALVNIVDPNHVDYVDYATFRTKIRQALNASIRTSRSTSTFALVIELIAAGVAVLNFVYVVLLTSEFDAVWFNQIVLSAGSIITLLGLTELIIRFNPLRLPNFAPITRLNAVFDGLALVAALVSLYGIGLFWVQQYSLAVDCILLGRAIDMIRIMRFFPIFRDVVRRSSDVFPALAGPLFLVLTSVHVFVYFGMILWGGAIDLNILSKNTTLTPLYYLNNFNTYGEGLVTMFNVLVVNDWHAIAEVFLYANRCSSPLIVYPFFVLGNLVAVSIMLNLITAFFVGSFVTKLDDFRTEENDAGATVSTSDRDIRIQTSERSVARVLSTAHLAEMKGDSDDDNSSNNVNYSPLSSTKSGKVLTFDVYEREGYDRIMKTVAGMAEESEAFAASVCDYLEVFESLAPDREKVGYVVCCQQTMTRFGNRRFQTICRDFIDEEVLYQIVSDMHSELLVLTSNRSFVDKSLIRTFKHKTNRNLRLEVSASLLRQNPAVSLLVSRIRTADTASSNL